MSTLKVNNIQPLTGTTVTVVANNSVNVSGTGKVVTPAVESPTSLTANAANGDVNIQLNGSNKLTVLKTPTGVNKTVNVVGDLYVSGGIYGNGSNITGVLAAGSGGSTSSGNLTIQSGTAGSGDVVFSTNTAERGRLFYTGDWQFGTSTSGDTPVFYVSETLSRVGVNTAAPTAAMHIIGDIRTTSNAAIGGLLTGGIGALATTGQLNWNDATNARSGSGNSLLLANATNGPGTSGSTYFHPFSFEYSTKDGSGNMTQLAVPYQIDGTATNTLSMRSRFNGTWSSWTGLVQQPIGTSGITVNSSGQVGINNSSPANRLDVVGDSQITGKLTLAGSSAGLAFPAAFTDTTAANVLDDYEEGTWTPALANVSNFPASPTSRATYTKIGNRVFFEAYLSFTSTATVASGSSAITITGLPFSAISTANSHFPCQIGFRAGWGTQKPWYAYIATNASAITLLRGDYTNFVGTDLTASTACQIAISGSYITHTA